jgi:uncharacterized protein YjbI with pentapeptide repeats
MNVWYCRYERRNGHASDLTGIEGASFVNTDLYHADFRNTNLSGADFSGAKNYATTKLKDACFYSERPPVDKTIQSFFRSAITRDCRREWNGNARPVSEKECPDTVSFWPWR